MPQALLAAYQALVTTPLPAWIEAIRCQVRAMDFVRGTLAGVVMWHEDMADSRANLVIEDMIPTSNDDGFFTMMIGEGRSLEVAP